MTPQPSIAHYRVTGKLGEGGMGEVWRATDTKLSREVAIKVIPQSFAADPDRMARFEREAQVLASLNHPNIASIYGIEERALVMELVEGAALGGPMAVEDALPLIHQMIDALEYAHEKGIVHRDFKPANVKVTPDGRVKVLDFGLAKAMTGDGGTASGDPVNSPTLTMRATMAGLIMGTAAYMAPEQARGHAVDKRADIWAFGVVVYELITGKQLFAGDSVSDILAAVLRAEIELAPIPSPLRRMVAACLERDPKRRMRDIGDARLLLRDEPEVAAPATQTRRARWPYAVAAASTLAALVLGGALWHVSRPVDRPLLNVSVDLGPEAYGRTRQSFSVSPDGARVAYLTGGTPGSLSLAVRELNQPAGKTLPGTQGADQPFFSPDGRWIAFFADRKLKKIPVNGGAPIVICDASNTRGGSWGKNGLIVMTATSSGGLSIVGENGDGLKPLTRLEANEASHRWPHWIPGRDVVLFAANYAVSNWDAANVVAYSMKTGQRKTLVRGGYDPRYLPDGYLAYVRDGKLFGMRFDPERLEVSGNPVVLIDDLAAQEATGSGQLDFARNGLLVYYSGKATAAQYPFGWMEQGGQVVPVKGAPAGGYVTPRLSRDGKRLLIADIQGALWIWDFERELMSRLPLSGALLRYPVWTPDGRHIVYGSGIAPWGISWYRADGSGQPVPLMKGDEPLFPHSFSPDGRTLAYGGGPVSGVDMWTVAIDATDPDRPKPGTPEPFLRTPANEQYPMFSPDGRWITYLSGESGQAEVYVRPFRGAGKWQISTGGGSRAKWSPAGRQLFYVANDQIVMVVDYAVSGDEFKPGKPRRWSDHPINRTNGTPNFDVSADGKRLLAFPSDDVDTPKGNLHATFLLNFFDEAKRRLR